MPGAREPHCDLLKKEAFVPKSGAIGWITGNWGGIKRFWLVLTGFPGWFADVTSLAGYTRVSLIPEDVD